MCASCVQDDGDIPANSIDKVPILMVQTFLGVEMMFKLKDLNDKKQ